MAWAVVMRTESGRGLGFELGESRAEGIDDGGAETVVVVSPVRVRKKRLSRFSRCTLLTSCVG